MRAVIVIKNIQSSKQASLLHNMSDFSMIKTNFAASLAVAAESLRLSAQRELGEFYIDYVSLVSD